MRILMIDARDGSLLDEGPGLHLRKLAATLQGENEVTLLRAVGGQARLGSMIRAKRPEIVHLHGATGISLLTILRALDASPYQHVPVALSLDDYSLCCLAHDLRHPDGRGCPPRILCRLNLSLNRLLTARIGLVHSSSLFMLEHHLTHGFFREADQLVLPYGRVLSPLIDQAAGNSFNLLCLGSMHHSDGARILVSAFRRLPDPSLRLHLVGDGPALRDCLELAAGDARVVFHSSPTEETWRELMASVNCAVLPSLWPASASPRLVEALGSNAVVVASRVGGIPEVIKDGINGCSWSRETKRESPAQSSGSVNRPSWPATSGRKRDKPVTCTTSLSVPAV